MLVAGLEPARSCPRGILSPLRLPIPPHQRTHRNAQTATCEWMEVDSNHRSKLQQIYSLSPLATRESTHMKFYCLPTDIIQINCLMQADDRTRTDNLLITNQLLCQLSHIGECLTANGWRWIRTTEAICSRFTVCPLWPLGNPSMSGKVP